MQRFSHRQAGFTLLELSLVVIVIGLLIGGIMVGQNLIRASELRSVIAAEQSVISATNNFKNKFRQLPGDYNQATMVWGQVAANCTSAAGTGTQTCNGNGDGMVGYNASYERFRFWQHLANSGMLPGKFTGSPGPAGANDHVVGVNCLQTKLSNVGFLANNDGPWNPAYGGWLYQGDYGNFLLLGSQNTGSEPAAPAFTSAEAYMIDAKLDDGLPGRGRIMSRVGTAQPLCATGNSAQGATAVYLKTEGDPSCVLHFLRAF